MTARKKSSKKPKRLVAGELLEFKTTDPGVPFSQTGAPAQPSAVPLSLPAAGKTRDPVRTSAPERRLAAAANAAREIELSSDEAQDDEWLGNTAMIDEAVVIATVQDDEMHEATVTAVQDEALDLGEATETEVHPEDDTQPIDTWGPARRKAKRLKERSVHDSIELSPLESAPDEELLNDLSEALRDYPEIDWASICRMSDGGPAATAIGLRVLDNYRENVDAIVKAVLDAGQRHGLNLEILLIDGHDLIREARESSFVFFPWKPKPFGS